MADENRTITLKVARVRQPIGEFYVSAMSAKDLRDIAFVDVRQNLGELGDVDRYLGIQRQLREDRVADLRRYVNTLDATFPTSIILAIDERCATINDDRDELDLHAAESTSDQEAIPFAKIARVLDGQHRIAGLYAFEGQHFEVPVSLFIGADISDQAMIFSTVNLQQTKVNKSLAYDLLDLARARSPQKTCHMIALAVDQNTKSPLYQRIKRLGVSTKGRSNETITQATFVESLLDLITPDPAQDRDRLLRGKSPLPAPGDTNSWRYPFRGMFIQERDLRIAAVVTNWFSAVANRWPQAWNAIEQGNVLNKSTGFRALMRFLRQAYVAIATPGDDVPADRFEQLIFAKIKIADAELNTTKYPPGSSGESLLYRNLVDQAMISER